MSIHVTSQGTLCRKVMSEESVCLKCGILRDEEACWRRGNSWIDLIISKLSISGNTAAIHYFGGRLDFAMSAARQRYHDAVVR